MEENSDDIYEQSIEKLNETLAGKEILLKSAREMELNYNWSDYYQGIYFNREMYDYLGKVVAIDSIVYQDGYGKIFTIKETRKWMFPLGAIKGIITEHDVKEKKTKKQEIEVGDKVVFKGTQTHSGVIYGTEENCKPIGETKYGIPLMVLTNIITATDTRTSGVPTDKHEIRIGTELIVKDIKDGIILPYYLNGEYPNDVIKAEEVEVVEKGYLDRIKNKQRKRAEEKEIIENLSVMDEMISKVNVKEFIKIFAGSVQKIPKDVQGMDLLLNQWAFNKKRLYLMLGRQLGIAEEIESDKDELAMREDQSKLARMFPGASYVIYDIPRSDFAKNELHRGVYAGWMENIGKKAEYPAGTKVSKILNEAFDNEKMNIAYSDIVSENKMKGVLEISIDPVEILLMSTNASGWDSCHKISSQGRSKSWGGYSGGIFSYMCDATSMIAFRHSPGKVQMKFWKNNVEIHSKNWRQMIWISEDMEEFICSRQYPAKNEETTQKVRELLEATIDRYKNNDVAWVHSTDMYKIKETVRDYNNFKSLARLKTMHYNDMLQGYDGDMCYTKGKHVGRDGVIVGSNPVCALCGKRIMNNSHHPVCDDCRNDIC